MVLFVGLLNSRLAKLRREVGSRRVLVFVQRRDWTRLNGWTDSNGSPEYNYIIRCRRWVNQVPVWRLSVVVDRWMHTVGLASSVREVALISQVCRVLLSLGGIERSR